MPIAPQTVGTDTVAGPVGEGSRPFPIVGVGASAGGLEAFTQMLGALPADTGMAFVLVQHLAPRHIGLLTELLSRTTRMPVAEAEDGVLAQPDRVYVIPPDRDLVIARGCLHLLPREEAHGQYHPIDRFLRSLAADRRERAIGVILSASPTDGTLGLQEIKAEGGITFAKYDTAQKRSLPRSAVATGCVDFLLGPAAIGREIGRIARHPLLARTPSAERPPPAGEWDLQGILEILRQATGVDFSHYRAATLQRRVARRMILHRIQQVAHYESLLRRTTAEVEALYQDFLIPMTRFFRDPEALAAVWATVLPRWFDHGSRQEPLRVWTLGCSTGEEAYSLAITLVELAEAEGIKLPVQIFATDLNPAGIEKARAGRYPPSIVHDVSPERLRRFFAEVEGGYRISKTIRDLVVFARHDVLTDPPFSQMDLISCRNLLVYLEPARQRSLLPLLGSALKPAGVLWLGSSESPGSCGDLFAAVDAGHRIYARKASGPAAGDPCGHGQAGAGAKRAKPAWAEAQKEADRFPLARSVPPGVPAAGDPGIPRLRGGAGSLLTPVAGKASLELLRTLRPALEARLWAANEELQSINEELETSKEEIQSSYEELATVNDELQERNAELSLLNNDLFNLLGSIEMAIVILDRDLRVRRFTPQAEKVLQLIPADLGRPIARLLLTLGLPDFEPLLREVLTTGSIQECEVRAPKGTWYSLRVRPYRTLENRVDGAVILLVDIDTVRRAREYAESIVASVREPLLVLDGDLRVQTANPAFHQAFQLTPEETEKRFLHDLGDGQWDLPELRSRLAALPAEGNGLEPGFEPGLEIEREFPRIGRRTLLLNARRLLQEDGWSALILLTLEDITARKQLEAALQQRRAELAAAERGRNELLALLAYQSRNPPVRE